MYSNAEMHLMYKVANAPVLGFPYPHGFVTDVFPQDFYANLQRSLPDPAAMTPIEQARPVKGAKERFVLELDAMHLAALPENKRQFWQEFATWLLAGRFRDLVLSKFQYFVANRFKDVKDFELYDEALLVEDVTKYKLGPHTDATRKVITMLFYLPEDDSKAHLGTSMYLPKETDFRCPGGPHYAFDKFVRLFTMPYRPNSLFFFVKTDNSFHGVEPVSDVDTRRWLLLYDIYVRSKQERQG
jgi:hypothetical protein